jgi:hypothetical protein
VCVCACVCVCVRGVVCVQVSEWLRVVGLDECVHFFRDAGVDGPGLLQVKSTLSLSLAFPISLSLSRKIMEPKYTASNHDMRECILT